LGHSGKKKVPALFEAQIPEKITAGKSGSTREEQNGKKVGGWWVVKHAKI